jgi:hypothetical protein
LACQVGAHLVSQRTSADWMDGRRVTLTAGATLRFGSLCFIYTGPAESVTGRTFARPPRPNVLTGAAGREAFVRGFSDEIIIGMLGPNPTQEGFRLAAYYLTDLAFQASEDGPLAWGEFMEWYSMMYPRGQPGLPDDPVTTTSTTSARPAPPLGLRRLRGHGPRDNMTPRGNATSAWPPHRAAPNRSRLRATVPPTPNGGRDSTNSRRRGASSMRSWPFFTKSWAWMPSPAADGLHKTSLCRRGPERGTATDASVVRLTISCTAAHQRHRHAGRRATTTDTPTRARTSMPTPMLTLCHSSGGRRRTLPLQPCCCAAAQRQRPPRSDGCANN